MTNPHMAGAPYVNVLTVNTNSEVMSGFCLNNETSLNGQKKQYLIHLANTRMVLNTRRALESYRRSSLRRRAPARSGVPGWIDENGRASRTFATSLSIIRPARIKPMNCPVPSHVVETARCVVELLPASKLDEIPTIATGAATRNIPSTLNNDELALCGNWKDTEKH